MEVAHTLQRRHWCILSSLMDCMKELDGIVIAANEPIGSLFGPEVVHAPPDCP